VTKTPDQEAINSLVADLTKDRAPKVSKNGRARLTDAGSPDIDKAIETLRRDPERREIFDGGIGKYNSPSEADGRMFFNIAFACGGDFAAMEEVARRSGRVRPKWDERRNGTTWLRWELQKAADRVEDAWEPSNKDGVTLNLGSRKKQREGTTEEDEQVVNPFVRADLTQALKDGVEPPEALVPGILLKGKVHSIYSAGGTGKTFKMLYLVKRVVEQGLSVLIFDMENGIRIIAERLEVLGVTPEQSKLIHYYPFPRMPLEGDVIKAFEGLLDEVDPALVVFDSWVNCLAACGLDENSSIDIATWADAYSQKARNRDIASLILDHVPKEGNTARGSGRKLDYVDVQWELRNPQPFNRKTVGRIDLHLRKDREGWLPSIHSFAIGGGEEGFIFKSSAGLLFQVDEEGLLPTDKTVKDALKSFGNSGAKDKDWKEASNARGIVRSTYYHSRKNLLDKGHVEQVMGKYFIKDLQNDESNEVQNSPIGLLDQGREGSPNGPTTLGVGPLDLHPDHPSVEDEDGDWMEI
jgi:hypothetical protein